VTLTGQLVPRTITWKSNIRLHLTKLKKSLLHTLMYFKAKSARTATRHGAFLLNPAFTWFIKQCFNSSKSVTSNYKINNEN
jgi:hypothetical protein